MRWMCRRAGFTAGLMKACGQMKIYMCLIGRGWVARDSERLRERKGERRRERQTIIHNTLVVKGGGGILAVIILLSPVFLLPSTLVTHRDRLRQKEPVKAGCCGTWAIKSSYTLGRGKAVVRGLVPRLRLRCQPRDLGNREQRQRKPREVYAHSQLWQVCFSDCIPEKKNNTSFGGKGSAWEKS